MKQLSFFLLFLLLSCTSNQSIDRLPTTSPTLNIPSPTFTLLPSTFNPFPLPPNAYLHPYTLYSLRRGFLH